MTSGSEKRPRNDSLTIRLTPEEKATIIEKAARRGLQPGSYAREVLLGGPAPRAARRVPVEKAELVRLLGELGKIGSNLNQLTRDSNRGIVVYQNEILTLLGGLQVLRNALMEALGRK